MTPPLQRITLLKPELLREASRALSTHGYTPWSFWSSEDDITIQFHAERDADLGFLRPFAQPDFWRPTGKCPETCG